jgi:hypothetical protein
MKKLMVALGCAAVVLGILCDTFGAICSSGLYLCRERKSAK